MGGSLEGILGEKMLHKFLGEGLGLEILGVLPVALLVSLLGMTPVPEPLMASPVLGVGRATMLNVTSNSESYSD